MTENEFGMVWAAHARAHRKTTTPEQTVRDWETARRQFQNAGSEVLAMTPKEFAASLAKHEEAELIHPFEVKEMSLLESRQQRGEALLSFYKKNGGCGDPESDLSDLISDVLLAYAKRCDTFDLDEVKDLVERGFRRFEEEVDGQADEDGLMETEIVWKAQPHWRLAILLQDPAGETKIESALALDEEQTGRDALDAAFDAAAKYEQSDVADDEEDEEAEFTT